MKARFIPHFLRETFTPAGEPADRIAYIDLMKGICILLVIIYHSNAFANNSFFDALRLPLYFFLSGVFFKTYTSFFIFLTKKVNNLLVPFVSWVLVYYVLYLIVSLLGGYAGTPRLYTLADTFSGPHYLAFNFYIWFLLCLFITNLIFYFISLLPGKIYQPLAVLTVALAGYACRTTGFETYFWLDSACTALPFFYLGILFKKFDWLRPPFPTKWYVDIIAAAVIAGIAYVIYCRFDNPHFLFHINKVKGGTLMSYISSTLLISALTLVCRRVRWLPFVSFCGRYSIILLCMQGIVIFSIVFILPLIGIDLSADYYAVVMVIATWLSIPLCRRFAPAICAQKALFPLHFTRIGTRSDEKKS